MPSFLRLITTLTQKINNNDQTGITYVKCNKPTASKDTITTGQLTKATYIEIAGLIQRFMDRNLKAPDYSTKTGLGTYWGYENIIYTYSKILDTNSLPAKISILPWNYLPKYLGTFTIQETKDAATQVKTYIETEKELPEKVTINGKSVEMPAFLQLLTTVIQKINNNDQTPTPLANVYQKPATSQDTITTGQITKATYIEIAGIIQRYMDRNQQTPNYSTKTGLGTYWGYENIIYTYSKILDTNTLPAKITITPWNYFQKYIGTFTIQQTKEAATQVKTYIENNKKLPQNVIIGGKSVEMPAFLQLLTTVIQKINNDDKTSTELMNIFATASSPKEQIHAGDISKSVYVEIAGKVQRYMDRNNKAPDYSSESGLGPYLSYQNLIYTYSIILDSYKSALPANVAVKPWDKFSRSQVASAATSVKNYVDTNHKLPNYVTINGVQVGMPSFLLILTATICNIENGINESVYHNFCDPAENPCDTQINGEIPKDVYSDIAGRVQRYMERNWVAPNYSSYSNLGTYFGYHNMIYSFSKVMDYYKQNNNLPNYVSVKPWLHVILPQLANIPSNLIPYTEPSSNCQSTNSAIVSLAYQLASGSNNVWEVGNNIFNWVRDNINYSFYYNTLYGAVKTLDKKSGNCVDTSHLMVALARAIGIPARYVHGDCYFIYSNTWYGHVFAQFYINGQWYDADGTSYSNTLGHVANWDRSSYKYKATYISLPF